MKKFFNNRYFTVIVFVLTAIIITIWSFYFGYQKGIKEPQNTVIRGVANLEEGNLEAVDFSLFWDAWQVLKNKHIEADKISNQDLVYGAISGLFGALGDPNSVFFSPDHAQKFNEDISGEFSGIGTEIGIRENQLVIIAPLKDTPAEKAGLKPLDKILKINETLTNDLSVDEAVKLIRGDKKTVVILTIIRNGWESPKEISITRDTIQIPTLDWEIKENNIVYINLYNFYEKAPFLFRKMATEIVFSDRDGFNFSGKNPKGIILDLRNNPGGYLEVATDLTGWFLKPGEVVVKEEFRFDKPQVFKTHGSGLFKNVPMVILINEGSASASEILAGALRDNRGIKLIGKKSFGKGTVQELEVLKNGSMAKITVAYWITPSGQAIEKLGLTPDYEVDLTNEDIDDNRDPQLEKAMEILKSQI